MNPAKKEYFLYLGPESPEQVSWAERPAYGKVVIGHGPLAEAVPPRGEKVVVLVPGSEVLLAEVVMPGRRGRIIKRSIPYALEENLAEDIDSLHFAHGPIAKSGEVPVVVVANAKMESWLADLAEHGIEARCLVPATLAIPLSPEHWSLVFAGSRFMLRKDRWHAYADDIESLGVYLAEELADSPALPPALQLYTDEERAINPEESLAGLRVAASQQKPLLELLAEGFDEKNMIDLLQGDYSRHAGWRELWVRWQLPAVAVALLVLLNIAGFAFDYYRLHSENAELTNRITAIYQQSFPGSRRVVNARAQMAQKLAQLQEDVGLQSGFFDVYDKVAPLLLATSGFSFNNLRFNEGLFDFDFAIKDLEALEAFKQKMGGIPGLAVEIKHAEAGGGLVKAKIQIKSR
jgi:general secretion pathway protein L